MRYAGIGIVAMLVTGCMLGGESSGRKSIGYVGNGWSRNLCDKDLGATSYETRSKIMGEVHISFVQNDSADFCVYLIEKRDSGAVIEGLGERGTQVFDDGNQCITVQNAKADPCIPFWYGKDLKKE